MRGVSFIDFLLEAIANFRHKHKRDPDVILLSFSDHQQAVYGIGEPLEKCWMPPPYQYGRIDLHISSTVKDGEPLLLINPQ